MGWVQWADDHPNLFFLCTLAFAGVVTAVIVLVLYNLTPLGPGGWPW